MAFNEFSMERLSEERDGLMDGPYKEAMKEYDCEAYEAGCTQSVSGFIFQMWSLHP